VENKLLKDFSFTSKDLATELAKCFCFPAPENSAGMVLVERRALVIPECPVYTTPIKYGVIFLNDPHWYDVKAAYETMFITHANRRPISPMTRRPWIAIEEVGKFSFGMEVANEVNSSVVAAHYLHKIVERLKLVNSLPRDINSVVMLELAIMMNELPDVGRPDSAMMGELPGIALPNSVINLAALVLSSALTVSEMWVFDNLTRADTQSMPFPIRMSYYGLVCIPFSIFVAYRQFMACRDNLQRLRFDSPTENPGVLLRATMVNMRQLANHAHEHIIDPAPEIRRPAQNNGAVAGLLRRFGIHREPALPEVMDVPAIGGMHIAARFGLR
jgi:hypothetical protein